MVGLRSVVTALVAASIVAGLSSACSLQKPLPNPQVEEQIDVELVWSRWPLGRLAGGLALDPHYHEQRIYLADGRGWVKALDAADGSQIWQRKLGEPLSAGPVAAAGRLLVADRKGGFYALDIQDGEQLWQSELGSEILAAPRQARGVVIARAGNGKVYGLEAESGEQLWAFERAVPPLTLRQRSAPAVAGSSVVVGLENGRLVALDATDGSVKWEQVLAERRGRTELERMRDIAAKPVIDRGAVYAVAFQGEMALVRMATGSTEWSRSISSLSGFLNQGEEIYVAADDGRVWALDRRSGATVWRQDRLDGLTLTRPVAYNGYLVVADNAGYVNWLRMRDGKMLARTRISSVPLQLRPIVTPNGRLYVLDSEGRMTALRVD